MASMLASLRAEKTLSVAEEKHRRGSAETPSLDPSTVREVNWKSLKDSKIVAECHVSEPQETRESVMPIYMGR